MISIISKDVKDLSIVQGINLWNEEWANKSFNVATGEIIEDSQRVSCADFIELKNTDKTFFDFPEVSGYNIRWGWYDVNKNFISTDYSTEPIDVQPPVNAKYLFFYMGIAYGTTYNYDICINLSNPDINGHYYPYAKGVKRITEVVSGEIIWQTEADKLRMQLAEQLSIPYSSTDVIDLGTRAWSYSSGNQTFYISNPIENKKSGLYNLICPKYHIRTSETGLPFGLNDMEISGAISDGGIFIKDTRYNNTTDFQNSLKGVLMAYEKS